MVKDYELIIQDQLAVSCRCKKRVFVSITVSEQCNIITCGGATRAVKTANS